MEILTVVLYTNNKLLYIGQVGSILDLDFLLCHDIVDHLADKMYRDAGAVT